MTDGKIKIVFFATRGRSQHQTVVIFQYCVSAPFLASQTESFCNLANKHG